MGPGVTVIPGGTSATITGGRQLSLQPATPAARHRQRPGLGRAAGQRRCGRGPAIAVILSAMLHDGTRGVRPVKRNGACPGPGSATARAASVSFSAIATGCVEFVLPQHRLAALVALTMASAAPACSLSPPRTGRA